MRDHSLQAFLKDRVENELTTDLRGQISTHAGTHQRMSAVVDVRQRLLIFDLRF